MKEAFNSILEIFGIFAYIALWVSLDEDTKEGCKGFTRVCGIIHVLLVICMALYFVFE